MEYGFNKEYNLFSSLSIEKLLSRSILSSNRYKSRIIYAGPKSNDSMVVYKIVEIMRGRYALEQTVINTHFRSIQTTLTTINDQHFEKLLTPEELAHNREFNIDSQIMSVVSYARPVENKTFYSCITRDFTTPGRTFYKRFKDWRMKHKMEKYLNKRI